MTSFTLPFTLRFPISAAFTSPCQFSSPDDFSLEDDYEYTPRHTTGIFDGSQSSVPLLRNKSIWSHRWFPEFQVFSRSYDELRPEILHAYRTRRQPEFSINEDTKECEPSYHDYVRFFRDYDMIPSAPSARTSPEICLPGLSELFFGKADIDSHRSPRKRRRRGSTFQQDPSGFPEYELSDCEKMTARILKNPFIDRDANTAKSREQSQHEILTNCEGEEMNQSSQESSHQRMQHEDINYEEPDPCPEKYRDPLWEEHIKSEESTSRSAKGKERADPLGPVYDSYNGSEQYRDQPYSVNN